MSTSSYLTFLMISLVCLPPVHRMSFDDWLKWFDDVGMVHVINNRLHSLGKVWYEHKFQGKWNAETKTFSAGGCVNYPDTFLKNPQVKLPVLVSPFLDMMHLW